MADKKVNLQTREGIRTALSITAEQVLKGELKANEAAAIAKMCETALNSIEKEAESWVDDIKVEDFQ